MYVKEEHKSNKKQKYTKIVTSAVWDFEEPNVKCNANQTYSIGWIFLLLSFFLHFDHIARLFECELPE